MHEALAVLPVGHAAARLHAVMRQRGRDEAFLVHHLALLELRLDVAEVPFLGRLAHGQLTILDAREIGGGPFQLGRRQSRQRADVESVTARVLASGKQALQRIEREWQRLVVDLDLLDGVLGGLLRQRGHGEDGLTHVHGLLGERGREARRAGRNVVGRDHAQHAFHLERFGRVDVLDARMRHGAGEQPAEHHAVGTKILGVLGRARDLGHHVVRNEVLADVLEVVHATPPAPSVAARITPFR